MRLLILERMLDLTVATGAVDLTSQVASLRLTGAGSNIITATAGDLTLPAVTDTLQQLPNWD